jgi:hypothetical protein
MWYIHLQDEIPPPPPSFVLPLFHPVLPSIEMLLGAFSIFLSTKLKRSYSHKQPPKLWPPPNTPPLD